MTARSSSSSFRRTISGDNSRKLVERADIERMTRGHRRALRSQWVAPVIGGVVILVASVVIGLVVSYFLGAVGVIGARLPVG